MINTVVIVGASLAGVRAAEELRRLGHAGPIVMLGDEPAPPYDRTPLSKAMLVGVPAGNPLTQQGALGLDWRLGNAAVGLDRDNRRVLLADGDTVDYDGLIITTGRRARPWPNAAEAALQGVFTLRTDNDGAALHAALRAAPQNVVIVGAGFIGSEVASSCRTLGLPVTVVSRGSAPLDGSLGGTVGAAVGRLYDERGVQLRAGTDVTAIHGDGTVSAVELADGSVLPADVVVVATGTLPNTEWLRDSGLDISRSLNVDGYLRVMTDNGGLASDIVAAGDVTRWPHPAYGDEPLVVEHWGNAVDQGRFAAHSLLRGIDGRPPFGTLPRFWSSMFGVNIKSIGLPALGDEVVMAQGSLSDRRGVVVYGREGRVVAAASFDAPRELPFYESMILAGAPFPPTLAVSDWGGAESPQPLPARFPARAAARLGSSPDALANATSTPPAPTP
ncbi:MAG: FAD-dependent pyridine nucleotide-disulfide oxidoreductase [Glaciihabitans sp.]|nr:FAD-dependent pyridine nucleotide-disulfide oxidoreductase [Glaciihabitans sp.]